MPSASRTAFLVVAGILVASGCGLQLTPGGTFTGTHTPTRIMVQNALGQPLVVRTTGKTVAYFGVPVGQTVEIPDDPEEAFTFFDEQCRLLGGRGGRGDTPKFITLVGSSTGVTGSGGDQRPSGNIEIASATASHC